MSQPLQPDGMHAQVHGHPTHMEQRSVIVGVDIPFFHMVKLLFTFALAAVPAMLLVFVFMSLLGLLATVVFGGLGALLMGSM
ncbi:MAG: hypothetical protein H0U74_01275 [Bradymonadaceae bacterium]|nr:hypothetical protein [Lujinxingiaceae bacterium]